MCSKAVEDGSMNQLIYDKLTENDSVGQIK